MVTVSAVGISIPSDPLVAPEYCSQMGSFAGLGRPAFAVVVVGVFVSPRAPSRSSLGFPAIADHLHDIYSCIV